MGYILTMKTRHIIHVDMDAFFASVEQRDNPALRGCPVLVGGMHRGVVAAASYEARRFGVHSAMPMVEALRRCPDAYVAAPRHGHYRAVSQEIFAIFRTFTPLVEGLSLDEAFLDVTGSIALFGAAGTIAAKIQAAIKDTVDLTASAGVAPCKFVAKLASDLRKPHGLVVVKPEEVAAFLAPLPVDRIWGVGRVGAQRLWRAGYATLGALGAAPAEDITRTLGPWGLEMAALARGEDRRPVVPHADAKSISAERTFAQDIQDPSALRPFLLAQALHVASRMGDVPCSGRVVQLKVKYSDFRVETRQQALPNLVSDPDTLYATACMLLGRLSWARRAIRLVGLGVSELTRGPPPRQLFADPEQARRRTLEATRAAVRARFGSQALTRASLLTPPANEDSLE
jgi:DNA polymerase-4